MPTPSLGGGLAILAGGHSAQTLKHIIVMGQSNGTGTNATPALTVSPTPLSRMFNGGTRPGSTATNLLTLQPLIESQMVDLVNGGQNDGETVASAMTRWLTNKTGDAYLVSNVALNAARMTAINKTTTPYNDAKAQVTQGLALGNKYFAGYQVLCVVLIHGETDQQFNITNYATLVATLQSDFETDAKAISGQSAAIPMFACQQNCYSPANAGFQPGNGTDGCSTAYQLLSAFKANPTKVYLIGPRYPYLYGSDDIHLNNHAQRRHGELYAKAIYNALYGSGWTPLYPTSASISSAVITVNFNVPVAPLVFDYALVFNPDVGKGFEYWDDSGAIPAISSVAIASSTSVTITLASAPSGFTYKQVRYGHTGVVGLFRGPRGCLRDSDSVSSSYSYPLYNHCAQFVLTF